ncbi:CysS/YqeB C-terminal domain-containing protein [Sphingopyxis sp.]|jgi:cysteinyl-tRNA synthetase|uniref:cysteine--tRNA ligase n=1 Tax=Sphingopyxis sp. TaxID=1908224 RepID=UPI002DF290C5|nr:cysteine--tRNA ligase [Sphingopyxis sp.]
MTDAPALPLKLFNSLTRSLEVFEPVHPGVPGDPAKPAEARVYSCGPTVYNYPHIGNMRAYVFADTLGRTLSYKGYKLTHVINITDVGHLTDDADAGEDKLEKAAAEKAQSIWDIARHYTEAYWADVKALNIRQPAHWSIATDYVPQMIEFAKAIADRHCYELDSGLYFDTTTVADYGRLAGHDPALLKIALQISDRLRNVPSDLSDAELKTYFYSAVQDFIETVEEIRETSPAKRLHSELLDILRKLPEPASPDFTNDFMKLTERFGKFLERAEGESRIDPVDGKRHPADFAIWRKTPPTETRQMEWPSPWGMGAPGWHLECSVMSEALLGFPFDIHTGGIDHREIHHPNEIAQNQAHSCSDASGARIWMHNNFLVERSGKMSKSSGEFLRVQLLIDKGYHPLAYRLMCLQAHYRSELEFSWEGLGAALTRLKRMVMGVERLKAQHLEASSSQWSPAYPAGEWTLQKFKDAMPSGSIEANNLLQFDREISNDLGAQSAMLEIELVLGPGAKKQSASDRLNTLAAIDDVLGLQLLSLSRADLRVRPKAATITEAEIEAILTRRKEARAAKDFAASDALRDELVAAGVEVMDGDPLGWDWRLNAD